MDSPPLPTIIMYIVHDLTGLFLVLDRLNFPIPPLTL